MLEGSFFEFLKRTSSNSHENVSGSQNNNIIISKKTLMVMFFLPNPCTPTEKANEVILTVLVSWTLFSA